MRIAFVSDIHANLQAWRAVLFDIRALKADMIICLGDAIGYGPQPSETLADLYRSVNHFVLGNHDAALCGKLDPALFNPNARAMLEWTRRHVGPNAGRFFARVPLTITAEHFRCAHGDFAAPGQFNYIIEPADALASWQAVPDQLLFTGHTHRPGIFLLGSSGTPHRIDPEDFELEPGKRYIVNAGSVGQPRDGDARSTYCLFDTVQRTVRWRRIPFDLDAYREALRVAGLDESASYFLRYDPRHATPPLRAMLDFNPPETSDRGAIEVVPETVLRLTRQRLTWWRIAALIAIVLALISAIGAGWRWHLEKTRHSINTLPGFADIDAVQTQIDTDLFKGITRSKDGVFHGWKLDVGNKYRQDIRFIKGGDDAPADTYYVLLESGDPDAMIRLVAPPVTGLKPGMKFTLTAYIRKEPGFQGSAAAALALTRRAPDGTIKTAENFMVKEPEWPRQGWLVAQRTIEIPKDGHALQASFRANFTGTITLKALTLERKE